MADTLPEVFVVRVLRYFLILLCCAIPAVYAWQPQQGDIIFHTSRSSQSLAIQKATGSVYSHMGIILLRDGKPYVYEAAKTVRFTPLAQWIARGIGSRYVVKRLKKPLSASQQQQLYRQALHYQSRPYDLTFSWDDERIYCSELVWKIYKNALNTEVGQLQTLREFDLSSPEVQAKMKERYGEHIPLNETVISPVAMFDSPLLTTVYESR
ncbi:YiiX family permuted papain-like enzyme [Morganella morganii subsp. sibonii]